MSRRKVTPDSPAMKRIVAALEDHGQLSMEEIADLAHVGINTIRNGGYMTILLNAKLIHVFKYVRNYPGPPSPIYKAGPDPRQQPAYKPKKFSNAERTKRWREKNGVGEALKERRRFAAMGSLAIAAGYRTTNERRKQA